MKFAGTVDIAAPRDKVWAFVIDPNQVGQCGPGVESIEVIDETHFKATAKVGIGFISARFVVNMEMAELVAPDRALIKAHGQAPGSAVDATDGLERRRRDRRQPRLARRASDRRDGQQDDRPDVHLHEVQVGGLTASPGAWHRGPQRSTPDGF